MTQFRLYDDSVIAADTGIDVTASRSVGNDITIALDGSLTHARFYHPNVGCAAPDIHPYSVWATDGTLLGSVDVDATGITGWVEYPLDTPIPVVAGGVYRVGYCVPTLGAEYAFVTLTANLDVPPLSLNRKGWYKATVCGDFPSLANFSGWYADVVFDDGTSVPPVTEESKGLTKAREQLLGALKASGIDAYYGMGQFNAPCARIYPAEPWVEVGGLASGRRIQRWEVWAVAGRTDSLATFDELEAMVMSIDSAIEGMPEWGTPLWRRPAITDMGGAKYFACRGTIETRAEVH
jgi:hypothetical protein